MRKRLQQLLPAREQLDSPTTLGLLGQRLHVSECWHVNRRSCALGLGLGLFCAFLPIPIGQMFIAAILALLWKANLPLAVISVWITNPLTVGPIMYLSYRVGALLLNKPAAIESFQISWIWFSETIAHIWAPLLLGCLVCGLFAGLLGHAALNQLWRLLLLKRWRARRRQVGHS